MPIAAIESLAALCDSTKAGTIHELMSAIEAGGEALKESISNSISLTAGCDLFKRFIISHAHDDPKDFEAFKQQLQANGHLFALRAREARESIAALGAKIISDGQTIFLHGHSRCIMGLLLRAANSNIRFSVIVSETRPSMLGVRTAKELRDAGVPVARTRAFRLRAVRPVLMAARTSCTATTGTAPLPTSVRRPACSTPWAPMVFQ